MPVTIHRQWPLVATTIGGQAGIHSICSYDECEFRGRESLPAVRLRTLLESGASTWRTVAALHFQIIDGDGRANMPWHKYGGREVAGARLHFRANEGAFRDPKGIPILLSPLINKIFSIENKLRNINLFVCQQWVFFFLLKYLKNVRGKKKLDKISGSFRRTASALK